MESDVALDPGMMVGVRGALLIGRPHRFVQAASSAHAPLFFAFPGPPFPGLVWASFKFDALVCIRLFEHTPDQHVIFARLFRARRGLLKALQRSSR